MIHAGGASWYVLLILKKTRILLLSEARGVRVDKLSITSSSGSCLSSLSPSVCWNALLDPVTFS